MTDILPLAEEAQVAAARARLAGSLGALQTRLAPKALAQNAVQGLVDKGQAAAQTGLDSAKKHPAALAGAVAAVGLLLARRPIARLFGRAEDQTPDVPARSTPTAARRKAS